MAIPTTIILTKNSYKEAKTTIFDDTGRVVAGLNMGANEGVDLAAWINTSLTNTLITIPPSAVPAVVTAENGLYRAVNAIRMGGPLIEHTDINTDTFNFTIGSSRGRFNFTGTGLEATTLNDLGGVGSILQRITASPTNTIEYTPYTFPVLDPGVGTFNLVNDGSGNFTFASTSSPTDISIYTDDGTLTGNRVLTMGANTLTFTGTPAFTAGAANVLFQVNPAINRLRLGDYLAVQNGMAIDILDVLYQLKLGEIVGAGNGTYILIDDSISTVTSTREQRFAHYGVGTYTPGTATYLLAVDATGNVMESAVPSTLGQNIYNTSDSLTADRVLTGAGFEMLWTMDAGDYTTSNRWAETGQTHTYELTTGSLNDSYFSQGPNDITFNVTDGTTADAGEIKINTAQAHISYQDVATTSISFVRLGSSAYSGAATMYNYDYTAATEIASVETLGANYAKLKQVNSGNSAEMGVWKNGTAGEIRLYSAAVQAATATATEVWTLTNATTGAGEWVVAPSAAVDTGIYVGSGTVPTTVTATLTDSLFWQWTGTHFISFDDNSHSQYLYMRDDQNATTGMLMRNADGGTSSNARSTIQTEVGGGDPSVYFSINGSTNWNIGIDNSDLDKFKISNHFNVGSVPILELTTTTGELQLNGYGGGTITGTPTYWLAADATGNVIEVAVPGGAQNLWLNMDADSGGPIAANTTTDTFTFVGGTGITTAISGDTVIITNSGAGAVTTASNGVLKLVNDVQLGNAAAGGSLLADFTNDRFQYLDTFNYKFESSTGDILNIDGGTNKIMIGDNTNVPQVKLHIRDGGGAITGLSVETVLVLQSTDQVKMNLIAGNTNDSSIYFGTAADAEQGAIKYYNSADTISLISNKNQYWNFLSTGQSQFTTYGIGTHVGTATKFLAVSATGHIIEEAIPSSDVADNGIIIAGGITQLGNTSSGTGTHDFTADRFIYMDTFDLNFETATIDLLRLDAANARVGIRTTAPGGTLHVMTDSSGGTAAGKSDDFIVEGSAAAVGMTLLGPNTGVLNLSFGTPALAETAQVEMDNNTGIFTVGSLLSGSITKLTSNSNTAITLNTAQEIQFNAYGGGTITGTAAYLLGVDASGNVIEEPVGGGGGGDPDQFLWETITADTGSAVANTITDTFSILGGTNITTSITGDILTIDASLGSATNIYNTSDSLTGNRILTGDLFSLNFNFSDGGGNDSTKTWQYNSLSESITDGTSTAALAMTPATNNLSMSSTTANQTVLFNSAGSTFTIRNTFNSTGERVDIIGTAASASPSIIMQANNNAGNTSYYRSAVDGGGGVNLYARTTNVDAATAVIGQVATLANAGDGRWEWATPVVGTGDQDIWYQIDADTGSAVANTTTDTLQILGGTGITTAISGDILTITNTSADTNTYLGNTNQTLTASRSIDLNSFQLDIQSAAVQTAVWGPGYQFGLQTGGGYYTDSATNYARFGHWSSLISPAEAGAYRRLKASPTILELYTTDGVTDVGYVRLTGATGAIESKNTQGSNISTITIDGASNTIDSTNGGGSYSRIITNGVTDTAIIAVYDGTDTTTLTTSPTRTKASSAWVDSGIYNDVTLRIININNYSYTDMDKRRIVRYDSKAAHNMTGLDATAANAENGMIIELWNVGSSYFLVTNNDVLSSPANRILTPSGSSARVNSNGCAIFRYDTLGEGLGSPKWRLISSN